MSKLYMIYRQDEDGPAYVTDGPFGVGYFSGPGELEEACKWKVLEDAKGVLDWLNDPETFYGEPQQHFIQELVK